MFEVKILEKKQVTHDIISYIVEKPSNFTFIAGQAVYLAVSKDSWEQKRHPFTIASSAKAENLEFMIKVYPSDDGLTPALAKKKVGEKLCIGEAWGKLVYKDPGLFLAAGTGVVPFLSMIREGIVDESTMIFTNKTEKDLFCKKEFEALQTKYVVTKQPDSQYNGRINKALIEQYVKQEQHYYICGPWQFTIEMKKILDELGVPQEKITIEL